MGGRLAWDGAWRAIAGLPHPAVHDLEVVEDELLVSTESGLAIVAL